MNTVAHTHTHTDVTSVVTHQCFICHFECIWISVEQFQFEIISNTYLDSLYLSLRICTSPRYQHCVSAWNYEIAFVTCVSIFKNIASFSLLSSLPFICQVCLFIFICFRWFDSSSSFSFTTLAFIDFPGFPHNKPNRKLISQGKSFSVYLQRKSM